MQVPESGQRPELAEPGYWNEVPRFLRMRADHEGRWPKDRQPAAGVDWSADPPGSYRSNGGYPLSPERHTDTIRYTFCLEPIKYAAGYYDIKQRLEEHGYEMYYSKNWWTNSEYKGINTRWVTAEGHRFEVQFHTPEGFHAKQDVSHTAYERLRNPLTSKRELRELHLFQQEVSSWIQVPDNATDIPDYEKEGF